MRCFSFAVRLVIGSNKSKYRAQKGKSYVCIPIGFRTSSQSSMGSVSTTTSLDNAGPSGLQSIATQDGRPRFSSQVLWVPWYDNSNLLEFTRIPGEFIPPLRAKSKYPVSELNEIKSWCCNIVDAAS